MQATIEPHAVLIAAAVCRRATECAAALIPAT